MSKIGLHKELMHTLTVMVLLIQAINVQIFKRAKAPKLPVTNAADTEYCSFATWERVSVMV